MIAPISISSSLEDAIQRLAQSKWGLLTDTDALANFIQETDKLQLSKTGLFERAIRDAAFRGSDGRWNKAAVLPFAPKTREEALWVDLFSYDGYQREKALLDSRSGAPNAFLLAIMCRRLNDWVPQVRKAARIAIERVVQRTRADIVVDVAWATLPIRSSWGRMEEQDGQILDAITSRQDVADLLAMKLQESTAGPAARVLRQACRCSSLDGYLSVIARSAKQPSVRARAYRMLFQEYATWVDRWRWRWIDKSLGVRVKEPNLAKRPISIEIDTASMLNQALADHSVSVRRVAGDALISKREELADTAKRLAVQLAHDKYPSMVERGKFLLKNL